MIDLSIIIVSYNTRELLRDRLESVLRTCGISWEAIVVDNHSSDGSAEMVARDFPGVRLIVNPSNRGFAAATNQGIRQSVGRHLLLLNPDTVSDDDAFGTMVRFLDAQADAAICGPRLNLPDGTLQSCGLPFPSIFGELRESRTIDRVSTKLFGPRLAPAMLDRPFEVDWVEGACLMARRQLLDQIGLLDERFFLFGEELDWCYAARQAGWTVFALPELGIVHYRGQSTRQREYESITDLIETKLIFFQKRRGLHSALFLAVLYCLSYLKQGLEGDPRAAPKARGLRRWLAGLGRRRPGSRPARLQQT